MLFTTLLPITRALNIRGRRVLLTDTVSLPMSKYGMSIVSWLFNEGIVHDINYKDRIIVDFEARDEIILKARLIEKKDKNGHNHMFT